ncbi:MAG: hypothetical protein QW459_04155 [Sulfolobales archaeon]
MSETISEDELLEKLARKIVDSKLDTIVIFLLTSFGPMGRVWAQLARLYLQPLLILLGDYGEFFLKVLQDPERVEKLVSKIEELSQ